MNRGTRACLHEPVGLLVCKPAGPWLEDERQVEGNYSPVIVGL